MSPLATEARVVKKVVIMVTKKITWFVTLLAITITSLPAVGNCADIPLSEFLQELSTQSDIEVRIQQLVDLKKFNNQSTGKMLYEPTGEVFANYKEIKAAIPTKTEELVKLLMKRYGSGEAVVIR